MQQRSAKTGRRDSYDSARQRESSPAARVAEPVTALVDGWNRTMVDLYDSWMQAVQTSWEPYLRQPAPAAPVRDQHQHQHHSCTCEDHKHTCDCDNRCARDSACACDSACTCRCCIGDVDLVINSRLGERRVVPLVIENNSRREREVEIELSDWAPRGGHATAKVNAVLLNPLKFTIPACAEETLTLVLTSSGADNANSLETHDGVEPGANRFDDVDTCQVFTADLRVKGCDLRPIRIAVSLLPRDCEPYVIDCQCGCC